METYKESVIRAVVDLGQTRTFARWALGQVDVGHYRRKYEAGELAELLVWNFT